MAVSNARQGLIIGDLGESSDFTISSATEPDLSDFPGSPDILGVGGRESGAVRDWRNSGDGAGLGMKSRQQLVHDCQLMKIELSQKSMALENCKSEAKAREEELQERSHALQQQNQLLQTRLDSELRTQRDESRRRQDGVRRELEAALGRQRQLEETNSRLIDKSTDLKRLLQGDLRIDEATYFDWRGNPEGEMTVRQLVQLRLYEAVRPHLQEVGDLRFRLSQLEDERDTAATSEARIRETLDRDREVHRALQADYQKVLTELADIRAQVQHGNYKIENFDRIQEAHDTSSGELEEARSRLSTLETALATLTRERDDLAKELTSNRQAVSLLNQDKEYLARQVAELSSRTAMSEERLQAAWRQAEEAKQGRDEVYERYVRARDEYRSQYETRLRDELDKLRLRTDQEMDKLKTSSKEVYERENRNLREQRDATIAERDRSSELNRDLDERLQRTREELTASQLSAEARISELANEVKLKGFEVERTGALYEETRGRLSRTALEVDKMAAKLEAVTKEYYQLESSTGRRISELELQLDETRHRLHAYDQLEQELDNVVLQAAELNDPGLESGGVGDDVRNIMLGLGGRAPTQPARRMQQSVELARRALHAERRCRELNDQLEMRGREVEELQEEIIRVNKILEEAQQPYGYLIEALKARDAELSRARRAAAEADDRSRQARRERAEMARGKNKMAADLERLLSQREEVPMLRRLVESMAAGVGGAQQQQQQQQRTSAIKLRPAQKPEEEDGGRATRGRKQYGVSYS